MSGDDLRSSTRRDPETHHKADRPGRSHSDPATEGITEGLNPPFCKIRTVHGISIFFCLCACCLRRRQGWGGSSGPTTGAFVVLSLFPLPQTLVRSITETSRVWGSRFSSGASANWRKWLENRALLCAPVRRRNGRLWLRGPGYLSYPAMSCPSPP